jgi:hypothetical protein
MLFNVCILTTIEKEHTRKVSVSSTVFSEHEAMKVLSVHRARFSIGKRLVVEKSDILSGERYRGDNSHPKAYNVLHVVVFLDPGVVATRRCSAFSDSRTLGLGTPDSVIYILEFGPVHDGNTDRGKGLEFHLL